MVKTWVPHYSPPCTQEEFENLCFITVLIKKQKLWLFVQVTLKRSFTIELSSWILSLLVVKQGSRGKNTHKSIPQIMANRMAQISSPCSNAFVSYNRFSKHLQFILPILPVQIDLLATATLQGCNSKGFFFAYEAETLPEHGLGYIDYEYGI